MAKKPPRRTPERIIETTLGLLNRLGELNVTTTLIAAQMSISPGNLYYHFPTKEDLINVIYCQFQERFGALLLRPIPTNATEFQEQLFDLVTEVWNYRFLFRDLSNSIGKYRHIETELPKLIRQQAEFFYQTLLLLNETGHLNLETHRVASASKSMSIFLTHWICEEYIQAPRSSLDAEQATASQNRGLELILSPIFLAPTLFPLTA